MQDYARHLLNVIRDATPRLMAIGDDASARRPAPRKWSPREIVGHLIDSASNNHQRFVRAQLQDDLILSGYEQDAWVELQRYQDVPWQELVTLWAAFNRHIAHVMETAPAATRMRPRHPHNLHQLAWQPVPEESPATLDYFMRDYIAHLEHHLRQLLGNEWSAMEGSR